MSTTRYPQFCALARAAEIVGERWTLLIVRELLLGPKRFGDLVDRLSGVSPTVLTGRLNALIESGVVGRGMLPPPFNAQVYELTPVGLALKPAIRELIRWGGNFLFPPRPDDRFDPDWVLLGLEAVARSAPSPARRIELRVTQDGRSASFLVSGGRQGTTLSRDGGSAAATVEARFDTLLRVISGSLPLEQAVTSGLARVDGSLEAALALPRLFDLRPSRRAAEPTTTRQSPRKSR
ncbi:MAG: helix-turn-helix domain-containing protein [Reyranellaceae bacterium]